MYDYDVLVIGAGPAGTAAAVRAAELGARTAIVEASRLGGTCVNTGCVPTRVFAGTARLLREVRVARDLGLTVAENAVDWPATVARVRSTIDRVRALKSEPDRFAALGIDVVLEGRARFTGPHSLRLDSGRELTAGSVILCVGGHTRRLPIPGAELAEVPEHVLDLPGIPPRLAIIGAGNTGAQLATIFAAFGSEVSLLDLAPRILVASDPDISAGIEQAFTARGVAVHTGIAGVDSLARTPDGAIELSWRDAEGTARTDVTDAVVMAAGWPADVADLGLEHAGIRPERSAVPVDEYFRSAVPHIFAAGDANGRDMLVQAAVFEGEAAAENAVLGAARQSPHHLLPAGGFTDPDYAGVGLTETQARERDERCVVARVDYAEMERPVIDGREAGFLKLIADRRREVILGAHAVGENAVEVIQAVTTAMAAGTRVSTLASVKFAYPTYSAIIGAAARRLLAD